ncbi:glutathione synthetase [Thiohalobacter thiocyanaticus]|uniref:Glutathione synthetase n=1 Tax=Thiohalobacter thiocyanaticus TaxID=585455 RepID=A0A1Z4VV69_9GAMM|nr:glutathione synthase [Thiohalobacter thiocyanaticus]BAZ95362.1 glutathione synthetase [Thiohalobacter thiocyanaticus]
MTRLGVLMDPIGSINIKKDSTFTMLLAARARHWEVLYFEQADLFLRDGRPWARMRGLEVRDDPDDWFDLAPPQTRPLEELDILLMRKDPPVDLEYFATTYILERAEAAGVLVANRPASLRDVNEKLYTAWFPQCCVPTLVSRDPVRLREFIVEQQDAILKPLYSMGGSSIFRVRLDDPNTSVILESLTDLGRTSVMAQRFIPEIRDGDKRILLIDGEPVPYALARIPPAGETRGNLAVGGRGVGVELTERDRWICAQVAPALREKGLYFVGLDVIGDYLTEVNVTSPTCIRELDREYGLDIAGELMDCLQGKLHDR